VEFGTCGDLVVVVRLRKFPGKGVVTPRSPKVRRVIRASSSFIRDLFLGSPTVHDVGILPDGLFPANAHAESRVVFVAVAAVRRFSPNPTGRATGSGRGRSTVHPDVIYGPAVQ